MKRLFAFVALLSFAFPAMAEEARLELFPKGRAAYQSNFDAKAEAYEVERRNLLDTLYETKGENTTPQEPKIPESDLDAYLDSAAVQNAKSGNPTVKAPSSNGQ